MKRFERSRRIGASPAAIWPYLDDPTRWPDWFTEAERAEILSGSGLGRRQRMHGHARGKATEIDSVVTVYEPERRLRWHHEAERVDGRSGSVVFARDATAEVTLERDGDASIVTYRLLAEPGSVVNWLILSFLAPGPIGQSFETSLARLARLAEG